MAAQGYRPAPRELDPINKVSSGIRGSIKLPVGMTYHQIQFLTNFTASTHIAKAELELNGDIIKTFTGEQLKMLESYKGQVNETGRFVFPLANLDARNMGGIMSGALVTYPEDSLILYITFGDLVGIATPTLTARAFWLNNTTARLFIPRSYETTVLLPKAGKNVINWERNPNKAISRIHMLPDAGTLTRLEIFRDNHIEFEADIADINFDLKTLGGQFTQKVPQTGYLHFDPTASGFNEKGLYPTAARESFKFFLHGSQAQQAVTLLVEELEVVPQAAA